MTLDEIKAKKNALEFKLGALIMQFEDETDLEVGGKLQYERIYAEEGWATSSPIVQMTIEI